MKRTLKNGFTLVEMAIVLAIIALILGTGLTLLSAQQDQRHIEDTKTLLSSANEELIGFALSQTLPHLPCPDAMPGIAVSAGNTANNGVEDRIASGANAGACDIQEGNLPWVTLGLTPQTDAWSNRLRYQVTAAFSNSTTGMLLTSTGNLTVNDAATGGASVATTVPAVILSHGKNGLGAINASGRTNDVPPVANVDELANTDGNRVYVSRSLIRAADNTTGVEFDDQVIWLSPYILFNRMVQAGKLP